MQKLVQEIHLWQSGVSHPFLFTLDTLARFLPVISSEVRGRWEKAPVVLRVKVGHDGDGLHWLCLFGAVGRVQGKWMKQKHLKLFCTLHIDQFCLFFCISNDLRQVGFLPKQAGPNRKYSLEWDDLWCKNILHFGAFLSARSRVKEVRCTCQPSASNCTCLWQINRSSCSLTTTWHIYRCSSGFSLCFLLKCHNNLLHLPWEDDVSMFLGSIRLWWKP